MTDIRNYLSSQKAQNGQTNLQDHLSNVLGKMLLDNTDNAYDKFEEYSHDVKFSGYNYKNDTNFDHKARMRETFSEVQPWADRTIANLDVRDQPLPYFFLSHTASFSETNPYFRDLTWELKKNHKNQVSVDMFQI